MIRIIQKNLYIISSTVTELFLFYTLSCDIYLMLYDNLCCKNKLLFHFLLIGHQVCGNAVVKNYYLYIILLNVLLCSLFDNLIVEQK